MENMAIVNMFNGLFKNKKVIITGDTGFKGSWLAIWLMELGAVVYGYALPPKTGNDNYVVCELDKKIKHLDGDIRDKQKLIRFFQEVRPEFAFHLAAQPLVLDSYNDPHYTFETNVMGAVNFFEAVRSIDSVNVAINITSDKCYKNNEWVWGYRESDPLGGKDPYSSSKACSEIVTEAYLESYFKSGTMTKIASVRAGNVIGAGDWGAYRIVPDFFRAYKMGKPLMIRNPNAIRPWQHVLEPLGGYLLLAAKLYLSAEYQGAWNFGPLNEKSYTVSELLNQMQKNIPNRTIQIKKQSAKMREAKLLSLDISKASYYLNWRPILNFKETVEFTVQGYLNDLEHISKPLENRIETIKNYIQIGLKKNVKWVKENLE